MAGINSFASSSNFTISNPLFRVNREETAQNQIPAGISSEINNKIIIDATPSGSTTLSSMRSIQQKDYSNQRDVDAGYVEVAFSPTNQINKDIVGQVGYFNLGDYLGNLQQMSTDTNSYYSLDILRDEYFTKYTKSYDLQDFIRLIKFYDNSLFKMVKDFTPSNVTLTAGVVVKQHILERNKLRRTLVSTSNETLSGSIGPIETLSGGAGGQVNRYQYDKDPNLAPVFDITQSWSEIVQTLNGPTLLSSTDQAGFYNGEYGNPTSTNASSINVIIGNGGTDCTKFTNPNFQDTQVIPVFLNSTNYSEDEFLSQDLIPNKGIVWLWYEGNSVQHIKVSSIDRTGRSIARDLSQATAIPILLNNPSENDVKPHLPFLKTGFYTWEVSNKQIYDNYVYFETTPLESPKIIFSEDANVFDIEFEGTGDFIWYASSSGTPANPLKLDGIYESIPQGYFPLTPTYPQEQFFRGWDGSSYLIEPNQYIDTTGIVVDDVGNFDIGTKELNTAVTSSTDQLIYGKVAATPKTPWFMNAPQVKVGIPGVLIQDQDPNALPRTIVVAAVMLTPLTSNCSTLNNNQSGPIIAMRFHGNEEFFAVNAQNKLVLADGIDGFATVKDILLYDPNQEGVNWAQASILQPAGAPTSPAEIPSGIYGVNKFSAQNGNRMIIQIEAVNNKQSITQIGYCF